MLQLKIHFDYLHLDLMINKKELFLMIYLILLSLFLYPNNLQFYQAEINYLPSIDNDIPLTPSEYIKHFLIFNISHNFTFPFNEHVNKNMTIFREKFHFLNYF